MSNKKLALYTLVFASVASLVFIGVVGLLDIRNWNFATVGQVTCITFIFVCVLVYCGGLNDEYKG